MKVFLSWSGQLSKRVAEELRQWLPNVIQALQPWLSSEDIGKGSRWSSRVTSELAASKAGIICVTPDNHNAPWLNFEAGAISNTVEQSSRVCTFLIGLKPTDLDGPLTQFQATVFSATDIRRLVGELNSALEKEALPEKKLDEAFKVWWPQLESALASIGTVALSTESKRSEREIAEETLTLVRELARRPLYTLLPSNSYAGPIYDSSLGSAFIDVAPDRVSPNYAAQFRYAANALGGDISTPEFIISAKGPLDKRPTTPRGAKDDQEDGDGNKRRGAGGENK